MCRRCALNWNGPSMTIALAYIVWLDTCMLAISHPCIIFAWHSWYHVIWQSCISPCNLMMMIHNITRPILFMKSMQVTSSNPLVTFLCEIKTWWLWYFIFMLMTLSLFIQQWVPEIMVHKLRLGFLGWRLNLATNFVAVATFLATSQV